MVRCDWSSDVCSSDLYLWPTTIGQSLRWLSTSFRRWSFLRVYRRMQGSTLVAAALPQILALLQSLKESEPMRVGLYFHPVSVPLMRGLRCQKNSFLWLCCDGSNSNNSTPASPASILTSTYATVRHLVQTHRRPLFGHATRLQDLDAELKLHPSPTTRSPANSPSLATPDKNVRSPWVPISLIKFVGQLDTRSVSLPPLLAKLILPRNNLTAGRNRIRVNLRFPNVNTTVRPAG